MTATGLRAVGLVEAAAGGLVLARAATALQAVNGGTDGPTVVVARVLGARMLGQGLVAGIAPSRKVAIGGAATDLAHAASMVPVASRLPAHRRPALVSAGVAVAFAAAQVLAATRRRPVVEATRP